jgi:hypothetical protein
MRFDMQKARTGAKVAALGVIVPAVMLISSQRAFSQHFIDHGIAKIGYGVFSSSGRADDIFNSSFSSKGSKTAADFSFGNRRAEVGAMVDIGGAEARVYAYNFRPGAYGSGAGEDTYQMDFVAIAPTLKASVPWGSLKIAVGYAARMIYLAAGIHGKDEVQKKTGMMYHFEASAWTRSENSGRFTFSVAGNYSAVPEIPLGDGSTLSAGVSYSTPTFRMMKCESSISTGAMGYASSTAYASAAAMLSDRMNYARPKDFSPVGQAGSYIWGLGTHLGATIGRVTLAVKHVFSLPGRGKLIEGNGADHELDGAMYTSASISIRLGPGDAQ